MAGPNKKLGCMFAHNAATNGSTHIIRLHCRLSCSAMDKKINAQIHEKTWGRANQCMLVTPSRRTVAAAVKNKFPPSDKAKRAAAYAVNAIAAAVTSATPDRPAIRC